MPSVLVAGRRLPVRRSPLRFAGSSPCSRRSRRPRPSRAATARGRPGRTPASSGTGTAASPPSTSRTSVSRPAGTQRSSSRLGSAVSSSTPTDFQPRSTIGERCSCPLMNRHAWRGPAPGCPYDAVGMQRALHSAIGLPSSSTSASLDARVLDAGGSEEKLHDALVGMCPPRVGASPPFREDTARRAAPSRRTTRSRTRRRDGGLPSGMPRPGSSRAQRHVPIAVPYSSSAATTRKTRRVDRAVAPAPEEEEQERHADRARDVAAREDGQAEQAPRRGDRGRRHDERARVPRERGREREARSGRRARAPAGRRAAGCAAGRGRRPRSASR